MPLATHQLRFAQDSFPIPFAHGSVSANTTIKLFKTSAARGLQIVRVTYDNPTGLAANASNFFDLRILNAASIAAKWSTSTVGEGALPANAFVDFTIASTLVFLPAATELSLALILTGTATLPAGSGTIEARLI